MLEENQIELRSKSETQNPGKLNGIKLMEYVPLYNFSAKIQQEKTLGQLRLHANLCNDKKKWR